MTHTVPRANNPRQRLFLYSTIALIALVALSYQAVGVVGVVRNILEPTPSPGAPMDISALDLTVYGLTPEARAAGVQMKDRLLEVNGTPVRSMNACIRMMYNKRIGDRVDVTLGRGSKRVHANIVLRAPENGQSGAGGTALSILLGVAMPLLSTLVGIYVAAARPRDPIAWIVMALMLAFSQTVDTNSGDTWGGYLTAARIYRFTLFYYWPLFLFLFAYFFPEPPSFEVRRPWLKWLVIVPFVAYGLVYVPSIVGVLENPDVFAPSARLVSKIAPFSFSFIGLMIAFSATLFGMKASRATTSDARRRLRLLLWGLVAGLTPLLGIFIAILAFKIPESKIPLWVFFVGLGPMILFPASIAYVIVVDRAMDVRMALRQGLQYAFARGGLVVLRIVTLAVFGWIGWALAQRFNGNVPALVALSIALLGMVLLINLTARRLGAWIDRRFFREAYNAESVLTDLTEEVRNIRETGPLLDTVCNRIGSTLHVARVAVVLQRNGHFVASHSIGFDSPPDVEFSGNSALVNVLSSGNDAPRVYFEDGDSWLYRTVGLDDNERGKLASLGSELLLPMRSRTSLLGFISAGQKRSEEPYSKSDVRVLLTVAAQTGLALENAQLTTAIAAEAAQRQRLASEVEIAREVQERLFPQTLPAVPGIDYAGMCRTALGVGGDYYDFLALAGGRFGFAVADVAGKGISAALMMASLQASLRGEMSHVTTEFAAMMGNLNNRVFEASTSNRYATFFFAVYTPETRRLDYVNAGHNPPILMRRDGDDWSVRTLEATGTVVGLLANSEYGDAHLTMQPGDHFVAFTDGISEAMNNIDEEWGEESLTETLRACAASSLSAHETMLRILSAADTFAAGAKQHDDMTLVVVRVL